MAWCRAGRSAITGGYFAGHEDQLLVESLNDAITILSGTGTQLGQDVPGFGTTDIAKWGYQPAQDQNWDSLDPLAAGRDHALRDQRQPEPQHLHDGRRRRPADGPARTCCRPARAGSSRDGSPSPHLCDQVGLFNTFRYKPMPNAR